MRPTFSHFLYGVSCIFLVYSLPTFAAGCSLSDTSNSPIQAYKKNIDTLNTFVRQQASTSSCDTSAATSSMWAYMATIIPMDSAVSLMKEVSSLVSSGSDFVTESDAFLDPAGPLNELKAHRDTIEKIERSIFETTQYVWAHCASWQKITEDAFHGQGGYNTRWRTLSTVLGEMVRETREVKRFFYILWQWIQTEEYIDEVPFPIASRGFSTNMYVYYSPKKLQDCRDNSPRKKAVQEMIKNAFATGWKYPQAIQVWKDAMALLLYRGSQLGGGGTYDPVKEAQINRIVKAKVWWLGNSDILINSQFFKEFWYRPNSKTTNESLQNLAKKIFYKGTWYDFVRKAIPSLIAQDKVSDGPGYIKSIQAKDELDKVARLRTMETSLYVQYSIRKESIAAKKAQDPKLTSDLAQIIGGTQLRQKDLKALYKLVCQNLGKQATNISGAWRC